MSDKELYLIFINELTQDYKGFNTYELLFTSKLEDITDDSWGVIPACISNIKQPENFSIDSVYILKTEYIQFLLAKNNTCFNMWDCMEGILPLMWENKMLYNVYPDNVLIFRYGEKLSEVINKINYWNETYKVGDEERCLEQITLEQKI